MESQLLKSVLMDYLEENDLWSSAMIAISIIPDVVLYRKTSQSFVQIIKANNLLFLQYFFFL